MEIIKVAEPFGIRSFELATNRRTASAHAAFGSEIEAHARRRGRSRATQMQAALTCIRPLALRKDSPQHGDIGRDASLSIHMAGIARESISHIINDWRRRELVNRLSGYYCLEKGHRCRPKLNYRFFGRTRFSDPNTNIGNEYNSCASPLTPVSVDAGAMRSLSLSAAADVQIRNLGAAKTAPRSAPSDAAARPCRPFWPNHVLDRTHWPATNTSPRPLDGFPKERASAVLLRA